MPILDEIIAYKRDEVAAAKRERPPASIDRDAMDAPPVRGFCSALDDATASGFALIAEIKKASPSKGLIRADFDPPRLAEAYQEGGAACLSVLTDRPAFKGDPAFLASARQACDLPVLRKDFMIDPYQVGEARVWEADAILLIMACLSDSQASELYAAAQEYKLDVLIEVHDEEEMTRALTLPGGLIGVNNRNLKTFEVDIATTERLAPMAEGRQLVAESGLAGHAELVRLAEGGVQRFLVGESLMRQEDVTEATKRLLNG